MRARNIGSLILILFFQLQTVGQTQGSEQRPSDRDHQINDFLKLFASHPKEAMQTIPAKFRNGKPLRIKEVKTRHQSFAMHRYTQGQIIAKSLRSRQDINSQLDNPEQLVENPDQLTRSIDEMEKSKLNSGDSHIVGWSSHYWPYYLGLIANRFGDPLFPASEDWTKNLDYIKSPGHTMLEILAKNDATDINQLSPAEKYDVVMGNVSGPLASSLWNEVQLTSDDNDDDVPLWMGICEGWSSAAIRIPRPAHTVTLNDPSGRAVTFYPADIKALSSLLWAWGTIKTRFIGGRCDEEIPATDSNGRITNNNCFMTNPATWHLVVTHQLGRLHQPFVLDAVSDDEVWNQPAQKYTFTYFNPLSGHVVSSLAGAKVAISDFTNDKFKSYRSKNAMSVVGIAMDVQYTTENESPTQALTDDSSQDSYTTVRYVYDLELDSKGNIIGGEWYHNGHPNFLWMPEPGQKPASIADDKAKSAWNGAGSVPKDWTIAAQTAAGSSQPLAKFVELLLDLSTK